MPRKPPNTGRIKPGEIRNPRGGSERQRNLTTIARLTSDEVHEIASLILYGTRQDLNAVGDDPSASILKVWMVTLIQTSMMKGDPAFFRALLDRILGRPKESVEMTGKDGAPLVGSMDYEAMVAELAEIERRRKELEL